MVSDMGDRVALYAQGGPWHGALFPWLYAAICAGEGLFVLSGMVTGEFVAPDASVGDVVKGAAVWLLLIALGLFAMWELLKASGHVVPLAWIVVVGREIRWVTPILRTLRTRGTLEIGEPIYALGERRGTSGYRAWIAGWLSTRYWLTVAQPGGRARCSGLMPVSDESFERASQFLGSHGCRLEFVSPDAMKALKRSV